MSLAQIIVSKNFLVSSNVQHFSFLNSAEANSGNKFQSSKTTPL